MCIREAPPRQWTEISIAGGENVKVQAFAGTKPHEECAAQLRYARLEAAVSIRSPRQQLGDRDICIDFIPMQAGVVELDTIALGGRCMEKAGKEGERYAERAPIAELDPHAVAIEGHRHRRNVHAIPRM